MKQGDVRSYTIKIKKLTYGNISLFLLTLYIFFLYVAQKTLLPPVIHSMVMYTFIGWTFFRVLCNRFVNLNSYTKWFMGMFGLSMLSFAWATDIAPAAVEDMLVALVITYCIGYTLSDVKKIEYCCKVFVIGADAMGLILLATGQLNGSIGERLGESITGNANSFSALIMMSAVFATWFFIYATEKKEKIFNLLSLGLQMLMMVISGGRKTILAVGACFVCFMFVKDMKNSVKTVRNVIFIMAAIGVFWYVIMHVPFFYQLIGQRFEGLFSILTGGASTVSSDSKREVLIITALEGWTRRPLLGNGVDTFKYYNEKINGRFYYAHNNYVELLYDLGIVGFGLYYGFLAWLGRKLYKAPEYMKKYKALGIGLVAEVLMFDIGGVSYFAVLIQILICISVCILKCIRNESNAR